MISAPSGSVGGDAQEIAEMRDALECDGILGRGQRELRALGDPVHAVGRDLDARLAAARPSGLFERAHEDDRLLAQPAS